jgi:ABC-type branched-subunit amino acid transport system ATPase component
VQAVPARPTAAHAGTYRILEFRELVESFQCAHWLIIYNSDMASASTQAPKCIVIAGPNGAGKTTFAREFLQPDRGIVHFVNVELIAAGLSPLRPALAARAAGRFGPCRTRSADKGSSGLCL